MLSNSDFKALLSSPSAKLKTDTNKTRFDLKQVKQWDKQINEKLHKKVLKNKSVDNDNDGEATNSNKTNKRDQSYRDRALERRKGTVDEEEEQIQNIVKNLDIEQSKFLGGDIEHTHLVKGLDYALLKKTKEIMKSSNVSGNEVQLSNLLTNQNKQVDIRTVTVIGEQIKNLLLHSSKSTNNISIARKVFKHLSFEFNLDEDSDLPTNLTTSKQVYDDRNDYTTFSLSVDFINKLKNSFSAAKINSKMKKKTIHETDRNKMYTAEDLKKNVIKPSESIDIYGGLLKNSLGTYSALDVVLNSTLNNESCNTLSKPEDIMNIPLSKSKLDLKPFTNDTSKNISSSTTLEKDIIDSDDEFVIPKRQENNSQEHNSISVTDKETDIMAPVRALLKAQHEREIVRQNLNTATNSGNNFYKEDKNRINRSAFDTVDDLDQNEISKKCGIALGLGSFDIFSDTQGFDAYDSDLNDDGDGVETSRLSKRKSITSTNNTDRKRKK